MRVIETLRRGFSNVSVNVNRESRLLSVVSETRNLGTVALNNRQCAIGGGPPLYSTAASAFPFLPLL